MAGVFGANEFIADTTTTSSGEAGAFVPELWSNEIIAAYKANLVLAGLVTRMNHVGKKGDTVNIPAPENRGSANSKAAETEVTPNVPTSNLVQVVIDKHYEYSTLIEDFAALQALGSMRRYLTDDSGYALSRQVETDLWNLITTGDAQSTAYAPGAIHDGDEFDGATTSVVIGSDGSTAFDDGAANGAVRLTDAGIRRMIQTLDDNNVPLMNRAFVVPPVEKNNLLGIARFSENAFTGEAAAGNSIRNGLIGDLYGVPFYVSTDSLNIDQSGTATTDVRSGVLLHKDAWVLIMQQAMRAQSQYMQQYLATLFTADVVYGVKVVRSEGFVPFIVGA